MYRAPVDTSPVTEGLPCLNIDLYIMKTAKEKIERLDLTMARRPNGNYEAYIN